MRVALIHDWLLGMRGGERCLEVFTSLFDECEIFTLFYQPQSVTPHIRAQRVTVSALQQLPSAERYHRYLLPLYPLGAKDLGKKIARRHQEQPFDLVISISHCAAKNVAVPSGVPHLCYCLTPVRYLWDQFEAYFGGKAIRPVISLLLPQLQRWDCDGATRVNSFAGISSFVNKRIETIYKREAALIFPPVRSDWIVPRKPGEVGEGFLAVNALVPYKNVDCLVRAFNELGLPLTIVGDGPEKSRLQQLAKSNIRFVSGLSDAELAALYRSSKALVFAAEEDFGMTPVEMQFAGRPVIAYKKGGSLETVSFEGSRKTGVSFSDLSTGAISAAVKCFLENEEAFTVENCRQKAAEFSEERFTVRLFEWLASNGFQDSRESAAVAAQA